jgi:hypothetical protein
MTTYRPNRQPLTTTRAAPRLKVQLPPPPGIQPTRQQTIAALRGIYLAVKHNNNADALKQITTLAQQLQD